MKSAFQKNCPRLFEAEALRDGRLSGAEVARYQSHLKICAACAREAQSLQALADALRSPENHSEGRTHTDELHVRRERTRLLAAFDARLAKPPGAASNKPLLKAVAALSTFGVACTLAFVLWPTGRVSSGAPGAALSASASPEPVLVQADSRAQWSRRTDDQLETISLESGVLSIRVDHHSSGAPRRLLVLLPDGELEDIGTTFSVTAAGGRTTEVSVQSGSVVLRLRGKPSLALGAGDSWSPSFAPIESATASAPAPIPAPRSARAPRSLSTSASLSPSQSQSPSTAATVSAAGSPAPSSSASEPAPSSSASEPDAFADFRRALGLLNSGDNSQAAAHFAAFLAEHPRDSRAEDAAYLRVIALQRASNTTGMKQAATEYLSRYPRGFRRAEVEPLAR